MTTNPVALIILDGWGVCSSSIGNAISLANLKYWDYLLKNYPTFLLQASGEAVGLPYGEVGNSEVGHLTIGSGQTVLQSLNRINKAILNGDFFKNETLIKSINYAKKNNSSLHLIGLLGTGGVHAYQAHLEALVKMAAEYGLKKVYLHLFLDGRDTARDKGVVFLQDLQETLKSFECGEIASLSGRFYGMDRNNNWDRIKLSYDAIVRGRTEESFEDPLLAIRNSYAHNIFDEEFKPVVIEKNGKPIGKIGDNDAIIFFNFRADRARQLTKALTDEEFKEFSEVKKMNNLSMTTFTEYQAELKTEVAFGRPEINETLASVISKSNLSQLHLAETEKYAHVTFFFNGLREDKFLNEDRILIPSPNVETYDLQPEMSAPQITEQLMIAVDNKKFDFYVVNYANPDMVGHTGNLQASIKAVTVIDNDLSKVIPLILKQNGTVLLTADHGNVEEIVNLKTGEIDKEHSCFPVPFVVINNALKNKTQPLNNNILHQQQISGILSDIAPTVLAFLKLRPDDKMKGINLTGKLF